MRRFAGLFAAALMVVGMTASTAQASTISFDFSNTTGSRIVFGTNSTFSFLGGFKITDLGSANTLFDNNIIDDLGQFLGTFAVGPVTTNLAGDQIATVTTSNGQLKLVDALGGGTLTADLNWVNIKTSGTGSNLNTLGTVNLTNFLYTGLTPSTNYQLMLAALQPSITMTFQFNPAVSLSSLVANGGRTSFSGTYAGTVNPPPPVPEPASMLLLGTGLLGVAGLARRRAKGRQTQN